MKGHQASQSKAAAPSAQPLQQGSPYPKNPRSSQNVSHSTYALTARQQLPGRSLQIPSNLQRRGESYRPTNSRMPRMPPPIPQPSATITNFRQTDFIPHQASYDRQSSQNSISSQRTRNPLRIDAGIRTNSQFASTSELAQYTQDSKTPLKPFASHPWIDSPSKLSQPAKTPQVSKKNNPKISKTESYTSPTRIFESTPPKNSNFKPPTLRKISRGEPDPNGISPMSSRAGSPVDLTWVPSPNTSPNLSRLPPQKPFTSQTQQPRRNNPPTSYSNAVYGPGPQQVQAQPPRHQQPARNIKGSGYQNEATLAVFQSQSRKNSANIQESSIKSNSKRGVLSRWLKK